LPANANRALRFFSRFDAFAGTTGVAIEIEGISRDEFSP